MLERLRILAETAEREKQLLLSSNTKIYCDTCKIVFFDGETRKYLNNLYYDFKLLAFRHVWDTRHKVKVETSYITEHKREFREGLKEVVTEELQKVLGNMDLGRFDLNMHLDYSAEVEQLRKRLTEAKDPRAKRSHDQNWDGMSICCCSICETNYHSPKRACYCHMENKPWMPWPIVDTLQV